MELSSRTSGNHINLIILQFFTILPMYLIYQLSSSFKIFEIEMQVSFYKCIIIIATYLIYFI